jgi:hypothetical protein
MACPKFVVAKILKSIEPERQELISKLRYNAYLVGNALLNTPVKDDFYDLYMLGDAKIDFKNIQQTSDRHGITDVVHGAFAKTSKQGSVISCYRALPFTGGRALIFAPESYESFRAAFENQIREQILPALGVKPETLVDVRVARWGHPMPVATPGLIASGEMEKIRRPFGDRVFFVEQDNWMLPAIETCAEEALHWAPFVRKAALG